MASSTLGDRRPARQRVRRVDRGEARRCVWAYANGGCDGAPAGCAGALVAGATQPLGDPRVVGDLSSVEGSLAEMNRAIPIPGIDTLMGSIIGTTTSATVERAIAIPTWAGGGTRSARCSDTGMCNEREKTLGSIARDAFCAGIRSVGGGGVFGC
jgi:hypothetical protein